MYALHDAGLTTNVLPVSQPNITPTDQLDRRAVEASERGNLSTDARYLRHYDSTAAVLELVEGSAQRFAEILEMALSDEENESMEGLNTGGDAGHRLDVYA